MDVNKIKEFVFAILGLIVFGIFLSWFGDLFRAHATLFFALWLAIPVFAWTLTSTAALDTFRGKALHHVRTWLIILISLISFGFFACYEQVRDQFGKRHIAGYLVTHDEEPDYDDQGRPYYPEHVYASSATTRWLLSFSRLACWGMCIFAPWLTWKLCTRAIDYQTDLTKQWSQPLPGE